VLAIINYCDLLLEELKTYGEEEVLREIIGLSKILTNISKRQNSFPLKIESLLLEGKLKLIQGEASVSLDKFNQAYDIASDHRLKGFKRKAFDLIKNLEDELEKWKKLYAANASIAEKIETSQIASYLKSAVKLRNFLQE